MKKPELIFVPAPGIGHLVSTLEFAKRLVDHDNQISITILVMNLPFVNYVDSYTKSLIASRPTIRLIDLPPVDPPQIDLIIKSPETYICSFVESHILHVKNTLIEILSSGSSSEITCAALIIDFFCVSMIDVANELNLPSYIFLTSNAGFLGLMLHLPSYHDKFGREVRDSDHDEMLIPGFTNPVPLQVLPSAMFNKLGGYLAYVKLAQRFRDCRGILVNTFAELEPFAIKSFSIDKTVPPIYPVGPVLNLQCQPNPEMDHLQWEKIVEWLNEQPKSSVVFLCFGSLGSFSVAQVREIAAGLEKSGCRFLWCLRLTVPPLKTEELTLPAMSLKEMLPEGFLDRTRDRGMACGGWIPQVEVLSNKAIGGFISHCGWNSILESLWYGVPIATLPIYAEQQLNAFLMVKELGLAVELKMDHRTGGDLVMAADVEKAVSCLMGREDDQVRTKVKEVGEMARSTVMEGGSSYISVTEFVNDVLAGCR